MISGRLALVTLIFFLALVVLQLSGAAADLNASLYQTISSVSGENDGYLIRRVAGKITGLGDTYFFAALVCLVLFWGWSVRSLHVARGFTLAMIAVLAFNAALKTFIATPRPESGQWMASFSFPSGHASAGIAGWIMLAIIAAMGFRQRSVKLLCAGLLLGVGIAVAISRVIIGVHWPIDVVAGVFEGLFVAAVFFRVVYQDESGARSSTNDPQLLLGMTVVMSVVYVVL